MLIVAALVFASTFVVASAQPSPECITANSTLNNDTSGCLSAYLMVLTGSINATDEQRMMVCSDDQQCNTMIENVTSACGNTVSS